MKTYGRLLIAVLAFGVLAFGGVYPWAYWPLAVSAFSLGLWAFVATRVWLDWRVRRITVALGVVAGAIGLQLVPLPYGMFMMLSPEADGILSQYALAYASQRPDWHPLSLDPAGTLTALALFVAFAALLIGLIRAVRYMPLDWLITQIMLLGVVLALVGIVQMLVWGESDDRLIYFFWRPMYGRAEAAFGPFINRNHYAGWMVMAVPLVLAYAWAILDEARRPADRSLAGWARWLAEPQVGRFGLVAFAGVAMATATILTRSRSGVGCLVVALVVLGAFFVHRFRARTSRLVLGATVVIVLVGVAAWAGMDAVAVRFELVPTELQERVMTWRDTWTIWTDFPVFGTGLGAYGMVMLFYQTAPRHAAYVQAHNDYLQLMAEGGLLVAIPAVIVIGILVVGIRRRFVTGDDVPLAHWVRAGAVAGLAGIAAQSLVEFSLQKPGNTVLFVLLLAIALHRPRRTIEDANRV